MKDKLIGAATEAVQEVASSMLFIEVANGTPGDGSCPDTGSISAIVGLSGGIRGSVRLAAGEGGALALASALNGEPLAEMNSDARDAYSEMCNMIAGGIQSRLAGDLGTINLTPPVVVTGNPHHVSGNSKESCVHTPFTTDGHTFYVEVHYLK